MTDVCLRAPSHSDIYMHYFKANLFNKLFPFYTRYVDDCFTLLNFSDLDFSIILFVMNSIDEHRQFTTGFENNSQHPLLDVMVFHENNSFHTTVYRRPFAVSLSHIVFHLLLLIRS